MSPKFYFYLALVALLMFYNVPAAQGFFICPFCIRPGTGSGSIFDPDAGSGSDPGSGSGSGNGCTSDEKKANGGGDC